MGYPTKIATCCYCGSRAALTLGKGANARHELACATCGAPLHELRQIPVRPSVPDRASPPLRRFAAKAPPRPVKEKARKRRKSWFRDLAEDAFEAIEDIFD